MAGLVGMKEISKYIRRSDATVLMFFRDMDFPMKKIGGIWESDTDLIDNWRRKFINDEEGTGSKTSENVNMGRKKSGKNAS